MKRNCSYVDIETEYTIRGMNLQEPLDDIKNDVFSWGMFAFTVFMNGRNLV